jgi:DnaK suppressor protein
MMTKIERDGFRKMLEARRAELAVGNPSREALTIETSADELDRIQDAGNRDWAMGNLERNSNRLREVQLALRRIDSEDFGICERCEEGIGAKRLAAVPWAPLCIRCQEIADREQATDLGEGEPEEMAA